MTRLQTYIVLSTAHLSKETSEMLDEMGEDLPYTPGVPSNGTGIVRCGFAYGHWIKVPHPDETDPEDTFEVRLEGMPESLAACLRHAASFGAAWILFDCDEPEIDALQTYEW